MTTPKDVSLLVATFERNLAIYKSPRYNETQLRHEFIDPFFIALGWDVNNTQGIAPAYKDVIHEDSIKIGSATKAPDYCFRIGGTRKFFLEAKKPAVDIKGDVNPAYQLRRYAWSAKLPLSILTDFEEFAVYDCLTKPSQFDKASTSRIMLIRYSEYPDKWEQIADIFGKDAVLKGSFDKYAAETKGKRGTSTVDKEFLTEIESWRDMLARNIALRNKSLSNRQLNYSVQLTIDRIIFLRMCEDRGIEQYAQLLALTAGPKIYKRLYEIFERADEKYNSGLFYFTPEKDRPEPPDDLTPSLNIDDKTLSDMIKSLYYPHSPYEFSVLPAEILGNVYEQFLGKVIRLTSAHQAKVEDKPEVKKAGGVYYTPAYIVDYIVKNTVGKLCEGKTPKQIEKIKILDPACGSGSFLIGAYQFLLDYHRDYYEKNRAKYKKMIFQGKAGLWYLTIAEKKRILLNNIFGVDIDSQAVEVTKLSLLLKVLEGENQQTLVQLSFLHERALPDLAGNIKCGNSLIGPDFFAGRQLDLFDDEEKYKINAFDWHAEFPQIFQTKNPGFDAVIGNPPYGAYLDKDATSYLNDMYHLQQYQLDSYLLFLEKSLSLAKEKGDVGLIIPNTWLLNLQSDEIRKHVIGQTVVVKIIHFLKPVFRATVDTEIVILNKSKPCGKDSVCVTIVNREGQEIIYAISQKRWIDSDGAPVNIFESPECEEISKKFIKFPKLDSIYIVTQGTKPFQVGKGSPSQTRATVDTKPFVADNKKDSTFKPLLRGSLINRYQNFWSNNYFISFGDWLAEPRYSANYDADEKIVIRQTGDSLIATIDIQKFIVRDNLYTIVPRTTELSLKYLLGLLNSRLLTWYYQNIINPERGEALAQVKRGHIASIPIRPIDFAKKNDKSKHDKMVSLVEQMLDLHKKLVASKTPHGKTVIQRQITATDNQIDQLVYDLYSLTEEEIAIVEGSR